MQRSSRLLKSPPHAQRNPEKYAAATKAKDQKEAETVARAFNQVIQDPKRNSRQIYLKRSSKDEGVEYLSTAWFSGDEKRIDWASASLLSQSKRAQEVSKTFAKQLGLHPDPRVQTAAKAVLDELTSGRATLYGGISSSHDLRASMKHLIAALDIAKSSQQAPLEPPQAVEPERQLLKNIAAPRSYLPRQRDAQQGAVPPPVRKAVAAQLDTPPVVQTKPPALCCAPYRGGPRFGAYTTSRADAALAVHRYLSEGSRAPDGFMSLSFDNKGAALVELRTANAQTTAEAAAQGRRDFAVFLRDLCEAFANHPDQRVRDAAAKGIRLAGHGMDQDLPNGPGMQQLFSVLALARPDAGRKPARHRTVTTFVHRDNPNRFLTAGRGTARELVRALRLAPPSHVLHTDVGPKTAITGTRAPVSQSGAKGDSAAPGSHAPHDPATCRLLYQLAQDFLQHKDANVRAMAQQLQVLAKASVKNKRAIPNHKGLHRILATLAQAS